MKMPRLSEFLCFVATFVWIFSTPIARLAADDYYGRYCANGEIPNPNGGVDDNCHCVEMTVFNRLKTCERSNDPDSRCSETPGSNGTTYAAGDLAPERTAAALAGCLALCAGVGTLCLACLALAGGATAPVGGIGVALCVDVCAGAAGGVCVALFTDCCGYHCNIVGQGAPSNGIVNACLG